ncbi:unnamed protein product [Lota lota]
MVKLLIRDNAYCNTERSAAAACSGRPCGDVREMRSHKCHGQVVSLAWWRQEELPYSSTTRRKEQQKQTPLNFSQSLQSL